VAIKIEFLSDTKDLVRGVDTIGDKLRDAADDLDDLGRAGEKSGDRLGDSFKGVGKDLDGAGDDVKTFEQRAQKAFRAVAQDAEKSGKDVGHSQKDGLHKASQGLDEFKDEANGTAKETAASFDGSADSIIGSFQEVAANAFAGFGPAGAAAGLALAAGLGIAQAALQGNADKANELGDQVSQLAQEIRAAGGDLDAVDFNARMEEWGLGIQDTKEWWELFQDSAKTGLDSIKDKAAAAGVGWLDAFKGTKGTMEDSQAALDQVNRKLQEAKDSAETYFDATTGQEITIGDQGQIQALEDLKRGYEDNITTQQRAKENAEALAAAGIKTTEQLEAEKQALEDANDELTTHAEKLAEAAGANLDLDGKTLDYQDTLKSSMDDIKANGKSIDEHTAAGKANKQTLIDLASKSLELESAQIKAGGSTADVTKKTQAARDAFIQAATQAGYTKTAAEQLATKYGLVPKNVDTKVKAHGVEEARRWPDTIPDHKDVSVNVNMGQNNVARHIEGMNGSTVFVNVTPRNGYGIKD
jgi:hypothetical protein